MLPVKNNYFSNPFSCEEGKQNEKRGHSRWKRSVLLHDMADISILSSIPYPPRLRYPADAHIDLRDLIPGQIVHDSRLRQIKDPLEGTHGVGGILSVDAVRSDFGDGWVVLCNAV